MPAQTRLRSLVAGVVPQPQAATETIEAPAAEAVDTEPPLLLTEEQLKGWVARGFIALPIDTLPKAFHDQFHAVQEAQKRGGGGRGDRAQALGAAVDAVLHSKIARGALTSILGPGFVGGVPGGGGSLGSSDQDQGYHSKSTRLSPELISVFILTESPVCSEDNSSNCAVRDIVTPRQVSVFYYPGKVGPGDGPTCFLPGTQYLALDREGLGQGEERLDPKMLPPKTAAQWHDSISGFTDSNPNPYAETDARRVEGMKLVGVPGLQENPMTIAEEDRGMIVPTPSNISLGPATFPINRYI